MKKEHRPSPGLIGKGGVGLVMFHLARHGIDFVETTQNSDRGDLWIARKRGPVLRAEVKTTTQVGWHIRKPQLRAVSIVFLVSLTDARIWVLTAECAQRLANEVPEVAPGVVVLTRGRLPASAQADWSRLAQSGSATKKAKPKSLKTPIPEEQATAGIRIVRRRLATGEMKSYRYCRETGAPIAAFSISFSQ